MRIKWIVTAIVIFGFLLVGAFLVFQDRLASYVFSPTKSSVPVGVTTKQVEESLVAENQTETKPSIEVIAENLSIPWEIAFFADGDLLVTERTGRLLRIGSDTQLIEEIEGVEHVGEGGLLGLALHPQFAENGWLYLYLTTRTAQGLQNRIERYQFDGQSLSNRQLILEGIPGAQYHDGGKIEFGSDGYLYVTTGDATDEQLAQDTNTLQGKILRLTDAGEPAPDNPFSNYVFSYGHRNPQGLAWDENGQLWSTEHGPSGAQTGNDELNLITAGGNYGWPIIKGEQQQSGMISPIIESGRQETWAPASAIYYDGSIFFTGLRGESLYQAVIEDDQVVEIKAHFRGEYGRLRALKLGPDGYFYMSTSNQDGRGDPNQGDDKIIKINPVIFGLGK